MNVYLLCAGVLVFFYFALSFRVSIERRRSHVGIGVHGAGTSPLDKAVRAQGNAAEYVPLFVLLFLYFNSVPSAAWLQWLALAVTACRLAHAAGMLLSADLNRPHPLRFVGALGTYIGGLLFGIALLWQVF
jgi:hypothetical protein